jgi:hypothetical protein
MYYISFYIQPEFHLLCILEFFRKIGPIRYIDTVMLCLMAGLHVYFFVVTSSTGLGTSGHNPNPKA